MNYIRHHNRGKKCWCTSTCSRTFIKNDCHYSKVLSITQETIVLLSMCVKFPLFCAKCLQSAPSVGFGQYILYI